MLGGPTAQGENSGALQPREAGETEAGERLTPGLRQQGGGQLGGLSAGRQSHSPFITLHIITRFFLGGSDKLTLESLYLVLFIKVSDLKGQSALFLVMNSKTTDFASTADIGK